ncbi:MAG: DUF3299 domain-containing protein [Verrucomicrobia bacterium]|nr:DUF3299 domain-containing protein [Verrucomicrobiota bacterium]
MRNFFVTLVVFLGAALIVFAQQKAVAQGSPDSEVRGKPIRGEPIRRPAKTDSAVEVKAVEPKATAPKSQEPKRTGFMDVSFDKLANFTFEVPEGLVPGNETGKSNEQIPADVRALNKKKVSLTGFMLPLKVDNGLVSEMLIMKDQSMCCYGAQPRINDWVSVKMSGKGVKSVMDQPVTLYGELRVGEMLENGYLIGIYEMSGEKMDIAPE